MFLQAKPVFPVGKTQEKNVFTTLRAEVSDLRGTALSITAVSFYQVWVNGKFVAFGPARTAKNYARVDVLPLDAYAKNDKNEILIMVAGYYCRSLSTVIQPSFVQAELRRGDEVLLATGRDFEAYLPTTRVQKVKRYSVQRHFHEVWDFQNGSALCDPAFRTELEVIENAPTPIERRAPYAYYEDRMQETALSVGTLQFDETRRCRTAPYSFIPDARWGKYEESEIQYRPYEFMQQHAQTVTAKDCALPLSIGEMEYALFDLKKIETGFVKLSATATSDAELAICFTEDCDGKEFLFTNMNVYNSITLCLKAGKSIDFLSFEPYVGRYFIVAAQKGAIKLNAFGIKTFIHDPHGVLPKEPEDPSLRSIFNGAVRTFTHNAVDIYMDCPSRERAGWLCDSYFTGKTEYALFGNTQVEDAFLENYRLYKNEGEFPMGALPMVYPADGQNDKKFIPQWTMWYFLEVEDYINNRGHQNDGSREAFRPSLEALLAFYKIYENGDGLLERLPSWNFIEWSAANEWGTDVNYPTNFLYAAVLEANYRLYGDEYYLRRANEVRARAIADSFDGTRFYDHSVRSKSGDLKLKKEHCSEIAQYYAILFGGFDIHDEKYANLYHLVTKLCYADSTEIPEDMEPINAFIGVYLRLEALLHMKEYDLVLKDVREFFGEMEALTGTLWEYRQRLGSRDHGFASYALVAILKALNKN
ncbi:MAG: hypothetical protein IJW16_05190 [Clostridia bacterium]|nr:hypothetical protein [Clostridia bacterium]